MPALSGKEIQLLPVPWLRIWFRRISSSWGDQGPLFTLLLSQQGALPILISFSSSLSTTHFYKLSLYKYEMNQIEAPIESIYVQEATITTNAHMHVCACVFVRLCLFLAKVLRNKLMQRSKVEIENPFLEAYHDFAWPCFPFLLNFLGFYFPINSLLCFLAFENFMLVEICWDQSIFTQ